MDAWYMEGGWGCVRGKSIILGGVEVCVSDCGRGRGSWRYGIWVGGGEASSWAIRLSLSDTTLLPAGSYPCSQDRCVEQEGRSRVKKPGQNVRFLLT